MYMTGVRGGNGCWSKRYSWTKAIQNQQNKSKRQIFKMVQDGSGTNRLTSHESCYAFKIWYNEERKNQG